MKKRTDEDKIFNKVNSKITLILFSINVLYYFADFHKNIHVSNDDLLNTVASKTIFNIFLCFIIAYYLALSITQTIANRTDVIYRKKWKRLKLIKKEKKLFGSGGGRIGHASYRYSYFFNFSDKNGEVIRLYGTLREYECLIEGAKVLVLFKAGKILNLKYK